MRVLLLKDIARVGQKGEVVEVKDGYGRNYLIREGLARLADASSIHDAATRRESIAKNKEKKLEARYEYETRLSDVTLEVHKKVNEKGHLFAAFTKEEAALLLHRSGFSFIKDEEIEGLPLKTAGEHMITIRLGKKKIPIRVRINPV